MTDIKEAIYYKKALDFTRKDYGDDSNVEYLGNYQGYEVYEIVNSDENNNTLMDEFIMANDQGVNKSYYHESVAIARKFHK